MSISLEKKHIKSKEVIGTTDGSDLHLITTYGGLKIIMMMKNNKPEVLGAGSHAAHAKFAAEKACKMPIVWKDEQ